GNFTFPDTAVATLDPGTGKYDGYASVQVSGTHLGSRTSARALDISPDGTRAVIGGNFTTVDGYDREQIVMLDLTGAEARVETDWATDDYKAQCVPRFSAYIHAVEFSPDGAYFVVGTTGGGTAGS